MRRYLARLLSAFGYPVPLKHEGTPAFNAGRRSCEAGVPRRRNPHREGTPEREAWFEGWDEQMKDELSVW
ncbi:ribosome modulation factor [Burkholderia multivorans]|uniref:ribosome modulation factor n=1 Tax=Burkholderia multivorans TaxID=87883 RepID=UPI003B981579